MITMLMYVLETSYTASLRARFWNGWGAQLSFIGIYRTYGLGDRNLEVDYLQGYQIPQERPGHPL